MKAIIIWIVAALVAVGLGVGARFMFKGQNAGVPVAAPNVAPFDCGVGEVGSRGDEVFKCFLSYFSKCTPAKAVFNYQLGKAGGYSIHDTIIGSDGELCAFARSRTDAKDPQVSPSNTLQCAIYPGPAYSNTEGSTLGACSAALQRAKAAVQ